MRWRICGLITVASAALFVPGAPVAADDPPYIIVDLASHVRAPASVLVGKPAAFVASITYKSGPQPIDNVGLWIRVPGPGVGLKTTPLQHLTISKPRHCTIHWSPTPGPGRRGVRLLVCDMSRFSPGQTKSVTIKITSRMPGRVLVATDIQTPRIGTPPDESWTQENNLNDWATATTTVKAQARP